MIWSLLLVALAAEPTAPPADPVTATQDAAIALAKSLGGALKGRVSEVLGAQGPVAAVEVCSLEAGARTAGVAPAGGAVGRSSLRLRNPGNAGPGWVQEWLQATGERPAAGLTPVRLVADTPNGRVARVILPIAVEAPCLVCHGDPASQPAELRAAITSRYPADQATGYAMGDLRGALWAELPIP